MKKYLTIIYITWQRALTYRFTVLAYRVGEISEVLILILMWTAIYKNQPLIGGYTLPEMISYILVGNLINVLTRNFLNESISRDIKDGSLSLFLIRPLHYFRYIITRELGRGSLAFIMSVTSQMLVLLFFTNTLIINHHGIILLELGIMIFLAFWLEMLLSYLISLIAFWTDEVAGLFTTIERLRKFFSGGYFPLTLLPNFFVKLSLALPFAYSFFIPTQLYLNKINAYEGLRGIGIQLCWILLLYFLISIIWHRGLKRYEGVGI